MSQNNTILKMLLPIDGVFPGPWISNYYIHDTTSILRYPSRIFDLTQQGWIIERKHDEHDHQKYYYRVVGRTVVTITATLPQEKPELPITRIA